MNLPTYIKTIGDKAASHLFGVSTWTVRSWRHRGRYPRPEKAREIVEKTGGRVSYEAIYSGPSEKTS